MIDIPEHLYRKAAIRATERGQSLGDVVVALLARELEVPAVIIAAPTASYWANRKLLPDFRKHWESGVLSGGTDSTRIISEDRDAR